MGWSLRRIAAELDVALSSASLWVRDVESAAALEHGPSEAQYETPELEVHRRCKRCSKWQPLSSFNRYRDGHQWWCRECFRAYFKDRGDRHRREVAIAKRRRIRIARQFIRGHLESHPCADCGESDIDVLEFDHQGPKRGDVSALVLDGLSLDALEKEVSGCEVVCANCHRRRTAARLGSWRLKPILDEPTPSFMTGKNRNRRLIRDVMLASGCVDCAVKDLIVLEFDHVAVKTANISKLVSDGSSVAHLLGEMEQCEVRCANCHRRETKARRRAQRHSSHERVPPVGLQPTASSVKSRAL